MPLRTYLKKLMFMCTSVHRIDLKAHYFIVICELEDINVDRRLTIIRIYYLSIIVTQNYSIA